MINVNLEQDIVEEVICDNEWIHRICVNILQENNHYEGNITIVLSNDNKLRKMQKQYFNKDVFTDVIAFNLEEPGSSIEGEIYISIERVAENAIIYKQDFIMELKRIVVHGCLHLVGYRDKTSEDKHKMMTLENKYLSSKYQFSD